MRCFVLYCLASLVYFKYMFSQEIRKLLIQVISSWQVLAVTAILILYVFLVNSVARLYRHHDRSRMPLPSKKARSKEAQALTAEPSDSEELGLEEAPKK